MLDLLKKCSLALQAQMSRRPVPSKRFGQRNESRPGHQLLSLQRLSVEVRRHAQVRKTFEAQRLPKVFDGRRGDGSTK